MIRRKIIRGAAIHVRTGQFLMLRLISMHPTEAPPYFNAGHAVVGMVRYLIGWAAFSRSVLQS
jgi:hypothetical protein